MKIIDLSIPIEDGLPSDPPIQIPHIQYCNHKDTAEQMAGFFKGATVNDLPEGNGWGIEFLQVCTHSGTHVDAPYHFCPEGPTIDQIPVENFQGHAVIADLRGQLGPAEPILAKHLEPYADRVKEGDILMLCTGWGQKRALTKEYCHDWPYISEEAAKWMTAKKLKGVSTDGLSVGGWYEGTGRPAHVELLSHGIWALEETILPDELVEIGECQLFAFPVKFQGFSGAPARAVAVV